MESASISRTQPESPMQNIKNEVERANARLSSIRNSLSTINDRLHGAGPPSGKDQAAEDIRSSGLLPSSREEVALTHELIDRIALLVENLDGAI